MCLETKPALVRYFGVGRKAGHIVAGGREEFANPLQSAIRKILISSGAHRRLCSRARLVGDLASVAILAVMRGTGILRMDILISGAYYAAATIRNSVALATGRTRLRSRFKSTMP